MDKAPEQWAEVELYLVTNYFLLSYHTFPSAICCGWKQQREIWILLFVINSSVSSQLGEEVR